MKNKKRIEAHSANKKIGRGDYYGEGTKNPIGKLKSPTIGNDPLPKKKISKPPRSLA